MMQRTFDTRLVAGDERDILLQAYANLYGRVERSLFARVRAGEPLAAGKRRFLPRFGLTARQFNAMAATVRGQIKSILERRPQRIEALERRIARARKVLAKLPEGANAYHQKQRRLGTLTRRLEALQADHHAGRVRICFGSRKLFRAQFALPENGYASLAEWRGAWRAARSNQFFVIGSADETAGCQGCVATVAPDGSITLRLRLPNALAPDGKYLVLPGLRFRYGHDAVVAAIGRNLSPKKDDWQAISWRFVRDRKGWRVLATVSVPAGKIRSIDNIGVVAVDLNKDHLAVTETDRFGNPVATYRVPCATQGKTHHQTLAILGEAIAQVVTYACLCWKPLVAERLDFEAKKADLEHRGRRYVRMLSRFAYATVQALLSARCADAGIALRRVHPAYPAR